LEKEIKLKASLKGGFMASADDILKSINAADDKLDNVNNKLDVVNSNLVSIGTKLDGILASIGALDADVQKVQKLLLWGFKQLITLGQYANLALFQNDQQNDTIICILEHISKNTCGLLNEAHLQTDIQRAVEHSVETLADLYAATHADAALTREREEALRKKIEQCCPPPPPEPVCTYGPCRAPSPLTTPPPEVQPPPDETAPIK
jgi:hypothetical protein